MISWKAAGPIPKSLILVLQNHLPLKEIKSESRFFWDRQGPNFEFDIDQDIVTANLPQYRQYRDWMRVPRIQISIDGTSKCEDLCLAGYAFPHPPGIIAGWQLTPPDLESFHSFDHIHLGRLRTLELKGCQDVGFMYNVLLHHISGLQLKFLILDQTETRPGYTGYTGREKLHEFLTTYKGLEEISFFNLAQSRQSIRTISAQRDSLRTLKLSESGTRGGSKAYVPWHLTDVDLIASQREHLQDVEDVASIRRALPNLQDLIIDGKRIE